jgi:spore germination protein YaaH
MTYHYHGRWENRTGVGAPLYSSTATIYTVHKTVQFWISKINSEKFVLGIPLYGPQWTLVDPSNTTTGASGSLIFFKTFSIYQL